MRAKSVWQIKVMGLNTALTGQCSTCDPSVAAAVSVSDAQTQHSVNPLGIITITGDRLQGVDNHYNRGEVKMSTHIT